jgi:hypothetical protein
MKSLSPEDISKHAVNCMRHRERIARNAQALGWQSQTKLFRSEGHANSTVLLQCQVSLALIITILLCVVPL